MIHYRTCVPWSYDVFFIGHWRTTIIVVIAIRCTFVGKRPYTCTMSVRNDNIWSRRGLITRWAIKTPSLDGLEKRVWTQAKWPVHSNRRHSLVVDELLSVFALPARRAHCYFFFFFFGFLFVFVYCAYYSTVSIIITYEQMRFFF